MALLMPFTPSSQYPWGPTAHTYEPALYAYLGRAWWTYPGSPFRYFPHFHPGLDLGAAEGTPIRASESGTITALGYNGPSGLRYNIRIRTSPKVLYVGGHLSGIAKNPRVNRQWQVGDHINRSEVIGYVGQSGVASGPHLHFGVQIGSMLYDPKLFFPGGANQNDWRIKPA